MEKDKIISNKDNLYDLRGKTLQVYLYLLKKMSLLV